MIQNIAIAVLAVVVILSAIFIGSDRRIIEENLEELRLEVEELSAQVNEIDRRVTALEKGMQKETEVETWGR